MGPLIGMLLAFTVLLSIMVGFYLGYVWTVVQLKQELLKRRSHRTSVKKDLYPDKHDQNN